MNYFELHIGDFDKATAHLTACEDGIYGRLMRRYYDTEMALTADVKSLQRFVRARSRDEREAVPAMLEEFFVLEADGWHHKRCDEEIARYQEKRAKAQRSANARWNPSDSNANAHAVDMRTHSDGNAHQTPSSKHQATYVKEQPDTPAAPAAPAVSGQFETHVDPKPPQANPAGHAAAALNRAGCKVTSQNPNLIAATAAGVTTEHLLEVYALNPGKPAGYVIAIARREHTERAATVTTGPPRNSAPSKTLTAIQTLMRGTTDGQRAMAERRDQERAGEAALPALGLDPG